MPRRTLMQNPNSATLPCIALPREGRVEVAKLLLEKGADITARDRRGGSPLHDAAEMGHLGAAELLVANRASINATDDLLVTPLHLAAEHGRTAMIELLLKANAASDPKAKFG